MDTFRDVKSKRMFIPGDGGLSSRRWKNQGRKCSSMSNKKTFFNKLEASDIRYIKMRHYAVIAYAELRRKNYGKFISNAMKSFFASPCRFFTILK